MDIHEEIMTDLLELEYRQQALLDLTRTVIEKALDAGWRVTNTAEDRPIPRLTLVPPIPDFPDQIA